MGYAQWLRMIVKNKLGSGQLTFKNAKTSWGKFHKIGNKDAEIPASDVHAKTATPDNNADISSSGRDDSASGTEGSYDIYDGSTRVCHIYWNNPWGFKGNVFTVSDVNHNYHVEATGANMEMGGIGEVTIEVTKA